MPGLFQGLEIGKRALLTHQLTMNTIGHNVSNVNTPGYTRQRAVISSAMPLETANYVLGNGVTVRSVTQIRDMFLTGQFRKESKSLGEYTYKEKTLTQLETFFNEPSDEGLGTILSEFWNSWLDLSNNPESSTARSALVAQTSTMINALHSQYQQLTDMKQSANADLVARVNEINLIAEEVANINRLVVSEEAGGLRANDLRDQRDLLIDNLSQMVDVTTREEANGSVSVMISGLAIVENADTFQIATQSVTGENMSVNNIIWKNTKSSIKITGGELKGLLDTRDKIVPKYMDMLDQLAASIVKEVNTVHSGGSGLNGQTGLNFFNGAYTSAGTIRLEQNIIDNPNLIAASLSGAPGDNANALAIAELQYSMTMNYGTQSITQFYNSMIGQVGVDSHEAITFKGNSEILLRQIENSRQSVQGVSLDEELANMIQAQHAYDAAAKVITYIDEALETLIHGMGVVGR